MIPTPDQIDAAARRIEPHVHCTPVMRTAALWEREIAVKLENSQVTGTFKARGAFNSLLSTEVPKGGVVAASGGNHGAAVAHAARALGHPATIFVPEIASPSKQALIRRTGADLRVVAGAYADALRAAQSFEAKHGAMQVHAYDSTGTLAGQGTLMREWEEQGLEADTVLIAVGGGGLIGGALAWLQGRREVVAVESVGTATLHTALRQGRDTEIDVSGIAADALGARRIGAMAFELATRHGVESVLVTDAAIRDAQETLWFALRQWVEPAGAAALAALRSGAYVPAPDERVAVLVCGANPAPGPFDQ